MAVLAFTPQDSRIAELLRRHWPRRLSRRQQDRGHARRASPPNSHEFGIGQLFAISAAHGDRVNALIEMALEEKALLP